MRDLAHSTLKSFLYRKKSEFELLKSLSLEIVIGEYGCSFKTLSQNGGIFYYEKEELTLKEIEGVVPFPRGLFVLISEKFVFKGNWG